MYKQQVPKYQLISTVFLVVLSLYGCTYPQPQELPFETVAKGIGDVSYKRKEPDFYILTESNEVDNVTLEIQFFPNLAEELRRLDYQSNFVVVVLRGIDVARIVDITQVIRTEDDVLLKVYFRDPTGSIVPAGVDASPYQIISVSKKGEWAQEVHFVLEVDGQVVKERDYFIP